MRTDFENINLRLDSADEAHVFAVLHRDDVDDFMIKIRRLCVGGPWPSNGRVM